MERAWVAVPRAWVAVPREGEGEPGPTCQGPEARSGVWILL